jgi:hypothetical protein
MKNKKFFLFSIFLIFLMLLFVLLPSEEAFAEWYCTSDTSVCESAGVTDQSLCCHNTGGCSSKCGSISWYGWCHKTGCCYNRTPQVRIHMVNGYVQRGPYIVPIVFGVLISSIHIPNVLRLIPALSVSI